MTTTRRKKNPFNYKEMNKNLKLNQKTMLVVALLALIVFYMWSRSISSYAEIEDVSSESSMLNNSSSFMEQAMPTMAMNDPVMTMPSSQQVDDSLYGMRADDEDAGYAMLDADFGSSSMGQEPNCALGAGIGLASSLLPREVAKVENFGDFAPDDILRGQNFLDTRNQIGFPETLGGNIRNGNQQIRADPPNPKQPYVWNNSTIVPDLMQRDLCT